MRLFGKRQPPDLPPLPSVPATRAVAGHDPWEHDRPMTEAQRAYLSEKLAAIEREAEALARLRRMGLDVDTVARRLPAAQEPQ